MLPLARKPVHYFVLDQFEYDGLSYMNRYWPTMYVNDIYIYDLKDGGEKILFCPSMILLATAAAAAPPALPPNPPPLVRIADKHHPASVFTDMPFGVCRLIHVPLFRFLCIIGVRLFSSTGDHFRIMG